MRTLLDALNVNLLLANNDWNEDDMLCESGVYI